MSTIIKARITEQPKQIGDPMPEVHVTLKDAGEQFLFTYYPDEISFTEDEFIGLTLEDARHLKGTKDKKFLTS